MLLGAVLRASYHLLLYVSAVEDNCMAALLAVAVAYLV
jgi:hypothetical protein